jgi:hypothetical protein
MPSTAGPSALWYLTRGTGAVSLVLLTLSLALGVAGVRRVQAANVPRFVVDAVHRNVSLLALVFLVVHIVTSLLDPFAPIRLIDAFIPFVSAYRPVWLGLGAVASNLLIALVVTSLLRRRFGYRAWRATHWLAYACWPIALVHTFGTGTDAKTTWMLALSGGCVLTVLLAVWARAAAGWPAHPGARASAVVASIAAPLALVAWLPIGPLAPGWAKRAGTPAALLPTATASAASSSSATSSATGATSSSATSPSASSSGVTAPSAFSGQVSGSIEQFPIDDGLVRVELRLRVPGQLLDALAIWIDGHPPSDGGVELTDSRVTLGTTSNPTLYTGRITDLEGSNVAASVRGSHGALSLLTQLQIDPSSGSVTGTVSARLGGRTERGR